MSIFKRQKRSLGISTEKQKYDLPLNKDKGNRFLLILMGLMAFLLMLTLAASFVLMAMNDRWSDGLENKATVEVEAQDQGGATLSQEEVDSITYRTQQYLADYPGVSSAQTMAKEDILALVSPWLGNNIGLENVPIPGLISVTFNEGADIDTDALSNALKKIATQIRLDTHQGWLENVLQFTGALQLAALAMTFVITVTTIVAVSGAIHSRMAVYREELELLHLMGASNSYIYKQLQRYAFLTILKGATVGMILGWVMIVVSGWLAGRMNVSLLPDFSMDIVQIFFLLLLPIIIALIGMVTARQTVLRFLYQMP